MCMRECACLINYGFGCLCAIALSKIWCRKSHTNRTVSAKFPNAFRSFSSNNDDKKTHECIKYSNHTIYVWTVWVTCDWFGGTQFRCAIGWCARDTTRCDSISQKILLKELKSNNTLHCKETANKNNIAYSNSHLRALSTTSWHPIYYSISFRFVSLYAATLNIKISFLHIISQRNQQIKIWSHKKRNKKPNRVSWSHRTDQPGIYVHLRCW